MRYTKAHILNPSLAEWQVDLLVQALAEIGFDSFEQQDTALQAYIPSAQLDEQTLQSVLAEHAVTLQSLQTCPDENWNSTWEQEHPVWHLPLDVTIMPHCAFGAGHHETTSMMIDALMATDIKGKRVFDHGTGTGVLAIFAKRLGSTYVLADDIDDNSVRNARENALQNGVDIDIRLAPTDLREMSADGFHLILANIHRNILLNQMADYARNLLPEGELWISGFYEEDVPALIEAAKSEGLVHVLTQANGDWRMIRLSKPAAAAKCHMSRMMVIGLMMACCLCAGCQHRSHLSSRKMVAVMTDLHRVDGMLQVSGLYRGHDNEQSAYYEYVLTQHGVTKAEFDSSLVWYTHHPQRFNKLYPKIIKNLEDERALFVGEAEQNRLMLEQRQKHFEWFTLERVTQATQYGYTINDYDLTTYRLQPVDTVRVAVPYKD